MDEEDIAVIYIALCNQLVLYNSFLEEKELSKEDLDITNYILSRTEGLLDKYEKQLGGELPIKRPSWTQNP